MRTASAHGQTDAALIQIELYARPQFDAATGTHISHELDLIPKTSRRQSGDFSTASATRRILRLTGREMALWFVSLDAALLAARASFRGGWRSG